MISQYPQYKDQSLVTTFHYDTDQNFDPFHQIVSEDEVTPLLAARHRLETRGRVIGNYGPDSGTVENYANDGTADQHVNGDKEEGEEEEGKPGLDENGNPTSSTGPGPFPIMDPQLRPLSIYR